MKVIKNTITILGEEFTLISDEQNGRKFYATIPHPQLDENGCLTKTLNGLQMQIADTMLEAIEKRARQIKIDRLVNAEMKKGVDMATAFLNIVHTPEFAEIYK